MKVLHIGFWWLLFPVIVLGLLLALLVFTPVGARFAATVAESVVPQLTIRGVDGSIAHGLRAEQVIWAQPEVTVTLDGLAGNWNPRCLLQAEICVQSLIAGRLHILVPSAEETAGSDDSSAVTPIEMPLLVLPWRLRVDQFYLAELIVDAGDRTTLVNPVAFRAEWIGTKVTIEQFSASTTDPDIGAIDATLVGVINMHSEWPFNAVVDATYIPPLENWKKQKAALSAEGNIRNLMLRGQLKADLLVPDLEPLQVAANVTTQALDSEVDLLNLQGKWNGAVFGAAGKALFNHEGLLQLENMQVHWGRNQATLNGSLQQQWQMEAGLDLAEPQLLAPDAQGRFTGTATMTGALDDPRLSLSLNSELLQLPALELEALQVQAKVAPLTLAELNVQAKAGRIRVDQEQLEHVTLDAQGDASHHTLQLEATRAENTIKLALQGQLDVAHYDWQGSVDQLQVSLTPEWQVALQKPMALQWRNQRQQVLWGQGCLADQQGTVCSQGKVELRDYRGDIQLAVDQFDLARLNDFVGDGLKLQGQLNANLHLQESLQLPDVHGEVTLADVLAQPDSQSDPLFENGHIELHFSGKQLQISSRLDMPPGLYWEDESGVQVYWSANELHVGRSCWLADRVATDLLPVTRLGQLCMNVDVDQQGLMGNAALDLAVPAAIRPWLPEELQVDGQLLAKADIKVKGHQASGSLQAHINQGEVRLIRPDEQEPIRMPIETLQLDAELENQKLSSKLTLQSSRLGQGTASAQLDINPQQPLLDLSAQLQGIHLDFIQPLVPQLSELQGVVGINLQASGVATAPDLTGRVDIQDLQLQSSVVPVTVDKLDAALVFDGDHGNLSGALRSGKGKAELSGGFTRKAAGWQAQVRVKGKNIPVVQPPDIRFELEPDISLSMNADSILVTGSVLANDGFMVIKPLPPDAINVSPDVVFVDDEGSRLQRATPFHIGVDLVASVEPSLRIRGFGAEVRPKGAIRVSLDQGGIVMGRGTIDIEEGSYTGYGQQLTIRKGQAIFNGPITQPYINLEAIRQVDTVVAGIRVTGPASEPVASLFSEPSYPDSQVLYYLIAGKAPGTGTEDENTAVRSALLSVGLMGGQPLARDIASKVGIDDLQMGTSGSGEETAVTVGGYLNSRTYLQYGINVFEPVNTLTVRYRLRDNLFLEAVSGIASALDILYSFEF